MKIITFSYFDKVRNWGFNNLEFLKLTLLVGASGVGKTQILHAINNLNKIANGLSQNGKKWDITFESLYGKVYNWKGEFQKKTDTPLDWISESIEKSTVLWEELIENKKTIIKRENNKILFQGKETVKLAAHQSVIFLLREEPSIATVYAGLLKIKLIESTMRNLSFFIEDRLLRKIMRLYSDKYQRNIIDQDLILGLKLLIVSQQKDKSLFEAIKKRYIDIFPQIEDIRMTKDHHSTDKTKNDYILQIKERDVDNWISQDDISSGMLRSLIQICELYLCPEGSLLLMDEFENSLGVNCIDELTNDILNSNRNIQFVLTSHHPYIINNIPYQNWKIVTRKAGKVTIKDAADYRIGESRHDYFMQLLQLDDFNNGIE